MNSTDLKRGVRRVALGWILVSTAGCSIVLGRGPSDKAWATIDAGQVPPASACRDVGQIPYLEAAAAVAAVVGGMLYIAQDSQCDSPFCLDGLGTVMGTSMLFGGAGYALSSIYGFGVNDDCARYHEAWNTRHPPVKGVGSPPVRAVGSTPTGD